MSIKEQITNLQHTIPASVRLVAVSKTQTAEDILQAWQAGQKLFGESRAQELAVKHKELPQQIEWHMIGHLQRNKVRMIIPFVRMIHSVDSASLLNTIEAEAARAGRSVDILLELHVAREQSKHGWTKEELTGYLESGEWRDFRHVNFRGIMGIASNTADESVVRSEFVGLRDVFETLRREYFSKDFDTLSMGMTSDYRLAIECGSTMVRIGSLIFSETVSQNVKK